MKTRRAVLSALFLMAGCAHDAAPHVERTGMQGEPDAIVVLGHRPPLDANGVEYETRMRVERGVALYKQGRAPWLLLSGGRSTPEAAEADVMADYAERLGVSAAALVREGASRDTIENARLSVELLREKLALTRAPRIVLVTSDYHIERATRLFECAGAEVTPEAVALQLSEQERARKRRSERWVGLYYRFIDECRRAMGVREGG